ncbi:MAG: hypothetical protein H6Q36_772, partial [Chloroflexi bacterium]|nr:hypothetical protein [Chloroflexota bacterium]
VPVADLDRAALRALDVARSVGEDVRAVLVTDDPVAADEIRARWEFHIPDVPLVLVESPYRALTGPFLAYLDVLDQAWPPDQEPPLTFVVIPEYVARHWWEQLLYNQATRQLRRALLGRPNTVVTNAPYRRTDPAAFGQEPAPKPTDSAT